MGFAHTDAAPSNRMIQSNFFIPQTSQACQFCPLALKVCNYRTGRACLSIGLPVVMWLRHDYGSSLGVAVAWCFTGVRRRRLRCRKRRPLCAHLDGMTSRTTAHDLRAPAAGTPCRAPVAAGTLRLRRARRCTKRPPPASAVVAGAVLGCRGQWPLPRPGCQRPPSRSAPPCAPATEAGAGLAVVPAHRAACAGGAVRARHARTPCAKRLACASDVFLPGSRTGLTRAARGQSSIGRLRPL